MKRLIVVTVLLCVTFVCPAAGQKPSSGAGKTAVTKPDNGWKLYGGELTLKKTTPLATLLKSSKHPEQKEVLVEGTVSEVCQNKGCWMVVDAGGKTARVEFKDYEFFVPWDSESKKVKVQGVLGQKTVSNKAVEHMLGEMKNPPAIKKNHDGEHTMLVLTASAVAIQGGSEIGEKQQEIIDGAKEREGHDHEGHDH